MVRQISIGGIDESSGKFELKVVSGSSGTVEKTEYASSKFLTARLDEKNPMFQTAFRAYVGGMSDEEVKTFCTKYPDLGVYASNSSWVEGLAPSSGLERIADGVSKHVTQSLRTSIRNNPWKTLMGIGVFAIGIPLAGYSLSHALSTSNEKPRITMDEYLSNQASANQDEAELYELREFLSTVTTNTLTDEGRNAYNTLDARIKEKLK